MKRAFGYLATLAVAISLFVAPAHAGLFKLSTQHVNWHKSRSANTYSSSESLQVLRGTGIENSAQQSDTTGTIDLRQWTIPTAFSSTTATNDSVGYLRFALYPTGTTPTVAADSIIIAAQVSDDGNDWIPTTYSGTQAATGTTPTSCIVLEDGGSANTFSYVVRQCISGVLRGPFFPGLHATVLQLNMYGYKFIRFIVTGDHTGPYQAEVTGFVPDTDPNFGR